MSLKIQLVNKLNKKNFKDLAIFISDDFNVKKLDKNLSATDLRILNNYFRLKKKENIKILSLSDDKRVILININSSEDSPNVENLGAEFYEKIKNNKITNLTIDSSYLNVKNISDITQKFLLGLKLKSYEFTKYKSEKKNEIFSVNFLSKNKINYKKLIAIETGINFARDLVSEPPNVLFPKEYVNRLLKLKKLGIKVNVYNENKLKKLGMHSLLGVGKGSAKESFLVTLEWYGDKKNKKLPLAFVGKGVCFDTGGISLKPAKFMEEMKYDMAGSAVVTGLIQSLAIRKAKVNAIGVVGLVENMPGGNAQRPGDIVKAYNGKTIEVLNTDAEGRLVLADALSFTEKKFKPKFIIDLATLTGAIIVALGEEYAGLFSNNDELSKKLSEAGEKVNEKVWRLPLHKNYDKLMDSTIADIQNINYSGGAGSITAAQFLQRFIEKTPWAHLDIAGMAFSKKAANLNPGGATGFGVRLLNQLIEDHYE